MAQGVVAVQPGQSQHTGEIVIQRGVARLLGAVVQIEKISTSRLWAQIVDGADDKIQGCGGHKSLSPAGVRIGPAQLEAQQHLHLAAAFVTGPPVLVQDGRPVPAAQRSSVFVLQVTVVGGAQLPEAGPACRPDHVLQPGGAVR